jgi:twitching motility protein PilJ
LNVLASEIERLANQSTAAAQQIREWVSTIQADRQGAGAVMGEVNHTLATQIEIAQQTAHNLDEVSGSRDVLVGQISELVNQTEQQSEVVAQLAGLMQHIHELAEVTDSRTRENSKAVGQLSNLARKLKSSVAGFKV